MSGPTRRSVTLGLSVAAVTAGGMAARGLAEIPEAEALAFKGEMTQGGTIRGSGAKGLSLTLDGTPLRVDAEGRFAFGFDRDHGPTSELRLANAAGATEIRTLTIAPREFSVQRIDGLPPEQVTPSDPATLERIKRENEVKSAARRHDSDIADFAGEWDWPVTGIISGGFGRQRILNGEPKRPHYGVDIAAPEGTPIKAPTGGIVRLAEPDFFFEGGMVYLDHGHRLISVYLHMSEVVTKVGAHVEKGSVIGLVGARGRATGPHLCWRMFWGKAHLDCSLLVPPMPAP